MKIDTTIEPTSIEAPEDADRLLSVAMEPFQEMVEDFLDLDRALESLSEAGDRAAAATVRKLKRRLWRETPGVTMIGQVKAGKTTLVNAMIGMPDLLPADINPWTSVVTSVHLSKTAPADSARAVFRFFDQDQWDRLIYKGGRIGELAGRAGANDEAAKIAAQLASMREKSTQRLGRKFELLMGQEHRYGYVDRDLVERYVCLGTDFENDYNVSKMQGRFADITQSADLLIHQPSIPIGLCIRDTPGVNDTFLMREQITIQAIRESQTCVVMLSAHQAMSTVDVALLRLIASIPSRSLVIFVNRIDELSDPGTQVPEIEQSIRQTLKDHKGPVDAEILFGSGYWATHAMNGTLWDMDPQSAKALAAWGAAKGLDTDEPNVDETWMLSGVPALFEALAGRIADTFGATILDAVAREAWNLSSKLEAANRIPEIRRTSDEDFSQDRVAVPAELDRLEEEVVGHLQNDFKALIEEFHLRIDRANASFVDRAVTSLLRHLEQTNGDVQWKYDPTGLRLLLRSTFSVYRRRVASLTEDAYAEAVEAVTDLYVRCFDLDARTVAFEPPPLPQVPPPVFLGETIALDLQTSWWSRWWQRRRGYQACRDDFAKLVAAETANMVANLKEQYGEPNMAQATKTLNLFIDDQRKSLLDLWFRKDLSLEDVQLSVTRDEARVKTEALLDIKAVVDTYINRSAAEG